MKTSTVFQCLTNLLVTKFEIYQVLSKAFRESVSIRPASGIIRNRGDSNKSLLADTTLNASLVWANWFAVWPSTWSMSLH